MEGYSNENGNDNDSDNDKNNCKINGSKVIQVVLYTHVVVDLNKQTFVKKFISIDEKVGEYEGQISLDKLTGYHLNQIQLRLAQCIRVIISSGGGFQLILSKAQQYLYLIIVVC